MASSALKLRLAALGVDNSNSNVIEKKDLVERLVLAAAWTAGGHVDGWVRHFSPSGDMTWVGAPTSQILAVVPGMQLRSVGGHARVGGRAPAEWARGRARG